MAETLGANENASGGEQALAPSAIHLLRTTTTVNLAHNQMADQKASMLMGAAFVVFTLTMAELGRGHMARPLVVLGAFAFVAAASLASLAEATASARALLISCPARSAFS